MTLPPAPSGQRRGAEPTAERGPATQKQEQNPKLGGLFYHPVDCTCSKDPGSSRNIQTRGRFLSPLLHPPHPPLPPPSEPQKVDQVRAKHSLALPSPRGKLISRQIFRVEPSTWTNKGKQPARKQWFPIPEFQALLGEGPAQGRLGTCWPPLLLDGSHTPWGPVTICVR